MYNNSTKGLIHNNLGYAVEDVIKVIEYTREPDTIKLLDNVLQSLLTVENNLTESDPYVAYVHGEGSIWPRED